MVTPTPDSPSVKLQSSFPKLALAAKHLNESSDKFTTAVGELDVALTSLNLGVTAWICFQSYREEEDSQYRTENQLGYAKIGNKRGLAVRTLDCDDINGMSDVSDSWLLVDAPRELRIRAIDHVPDLIEELVKQTQQMAEKVADKAIFAVEIANQVKTFVGNGGKR